MKTRLALNSEISTSLNPGCWEKDFKNNNQKEKKLKFHSQVFDQSLITPFHIRQQKLYNSRSSKLSSFSAWGANVWCSWMAQDHCITIPCLGHQSKKEEKRSPPKSASTWTVWEQESILCPVLKSLSQIPEVSVKFLQLSLSPHPLTHTPITNACVHFIIHWYFRPVCGSPWMM